MSKSLDDMIEEAMRKHGKSLSTSTISVLVKRDVRRVEAKLERMHKFNRIRPTTTRRVRFWKLKRK